MTKEELKSKYIDRKGFVVCGAIPSKEESAKSLVNTFKKVHLTSESPELIVSFENGKDYVFIYKENSDLNLPKLFEYTDSTLMMFGHIFRTKTLREYLN